MNRLNTRLQSRTASTSIILYRYVPAYNTSNKTPLTVRVVVPPITRTIIPCQVCIIHTRRIKEIFPCVVKS